MEAEKYDYIIAHYLLDFISDITGLISHAAYVLKKGGMLSINGYEVSCEHFFWKECFSDMGLKSGFIDEKRKLEECQKDRFVELLQRHFATVETIILDNGMKYDNSENIVERLYQRYPENKKYIEENEKYIKQYFERVLESEKSIVIENTSSFWHCFK